MEIDSSKLKKLIWDTIEQKDTKSIQKVFEFLEHPFDDDIIDYLLETLSSAGNQEMLKAIFDCYPYIREAALNGRFTLSVIEFSSIEIIKYLLQLDDFNNLWFSAHPMFDGHPNLLHYCCIEATPEIIEVLCRDDFEVDFKDGHGRTAFYKAFKEERYENAKKLHDLGAYVFQETFEGKVAFFESENPLGLIAMQEMGYDLSYVNNYGQNIYFHGNLEVLEWCLDKNKDYFRIDDNGNNALQWRISNGDFSATKLFLELGFDINKADNNKWTALHFACIYNMPQMVITILRGGANVNALTNLGQTALHIACKNDHDRIVEILLGFDADQNVQDIAGNEPGRYTSDAHIQCMLEYYKFEIPPRKVNYDNLQQAVKDGKIKDVDSIIQGGYDYENAKYDLNDHPLFLSLESTGYHSSDIFCMVFDLFRPNLPLDDNGRDILHHAVINNKEDIVKLLLEDGWNASLQDKEGNGPIHYAVYNKNYNLVRELVIAGADPSIMNNKKEQPIYIAINLGCLELVRFFNHDIKRINNYFNLEADDVDIDEWLEMEENSNNSYDMNYYSDPSKHNSSNPWREVLGDEEADDAYWNTD